MRQETILHWERHYVEVDTFEEAVTEVQRLWADFAARGGHVEALTIKRRIPASAGWQVVTEYRTETDEECDRMGLT